MAIDIVARGLATQLIGPDGKISTKKMPTLNGTSGLSGFTSIGKLTDPAMVEGKTSEEILLMMLYGVINPTLTAPSLDIALNDIQLIVGRESVIEGALTFDRGKIEPAYGTSGYRAGLPTSFTIANQESATNDTVYNFSFTLTPIAGDNVINYSVNYSAGEQPLNSIGSAVDQPLVAGSLSGNITLRAVYPLYSATGEDLDFTWFKDEDGEGYLSTFASEASGVVSFAHGWMAKALHEGAFVTGNNTKSSKAYQMVLGQFNADDASAALIIGNGSAATPSNVMTVSTGGALKLCSGGSLTIGTTEITETQLQQLTNPIDTSNFKVTNLTVDNNYIGGSSQKSSYFMPESDPITYNNSDVTLEFNRGEWIETSVYKYYILISGVTNLRVGDYIEGLTITYRMTDWPPETYTISGFYTQNGLYCADAHEGFLWDLTPVDGGIFTVTPCVKKSPQFAFAHGNSLVLNGSYKAIFGVYNAYDELHNDNELLVVGNGLSDSYRRNAMVVNREGNLKIATSITIGNTTITEAQLQQLLTLLNTQNAEEVTF